MQIGNMGEHREDQIIALDLLRGAAALLVFFTHLRGAAFVEFGALTQSSQTHLTEVLFGISRLGHEAVLVFFILSGFLVGGKAINQLRDGRFNLPAYAIDRTTRIFLPLIPACLLTILVDHYFFRQQPEWRAFAVNAMGLNGVLGPTLDGNAPLWSLAYEIWFYILMGASCYIVADGQRRFAAFFALALGILVFCELSPRYLLFWIAGAFCIRMLGTRMSFAAGLLGLVLAIVGSSLYQLGSESKSFVTIHIVSQPVAEALICVGVCFAIPFLSGRRCNRMLKALRGPGQFLSSRSYSIYLFHYPLNIAAGCWLPRTADITALSLSMFCLRALSILLTIEVLYRVFERNTAWLRWFCKHQLDLLKTDTSKLHKLELAE